MVYVPFLIHQNLPVRSQWIQEVSEYRKDSSRRSFMVMAREKGKGTPKVQKECKNPSFFYSALPLSSTQVILWWLWHQESKLWWMENLHLCSVGLYFQEYEDKSCFFFLLSSVFFLHLGPSYTSNISEVHNGAMKSKCNSLAKNWEEEISLRGRSLGKWPPYCCLWYPGLILK